MNNLKKKRLYQLTLLPFLLFSIFSCAQPKSVIKKEYLFYTEHLPGNIPADEKGNPKPGLPDTVIIVYLETTTKSIRWDTAWQSGNSYKVMAILLETLPFEAGNAKDNDKKIVLNVAKGNYLWQLYLLPIYQEKPLKQQSKGNEILIKGKYKGKKIFRKINGAIQLEAISSV